MSQPRQPAGVPTGGRFAAGAQSRAGIALEPGNDTGQASIEQLLREFDGSAPDALRALADYCGLAVLHLDRGSFENDLNGGPLTDDEWARVRPLLTDFAQWVNNSGARESLDGYRAQVLERAGVDVDVERCSECGESLEDNEGYDGLCGNCADRAEAAGAWA